MLLKFECYFQGVLKLMFLIFETTNANTTGVHSIALFDMQVNKQEYKHQAKGQSETCVSYFPDK